MERITSRFQSIPLYVPYYGISVVIGLDEPRYRRQKGRQYTRRYMEPDGYLRVRPRSGAVAKFWRLPRVEHAGAICASEPEVADDPERPCREAEAPIQGRFQGPALRSDADPAGGLVVSALSAQLP